MLKGPAGKNRSMRSTETTLHDTAPASESPSAALPEADPTNQSRPVKSLWRRMVSPLYIFTAGPWIAFAVLLSQAVLASLVSGLVASVLGLILLPFAAIGFGIYERWRLAKTGYGLIPNGHLDYPGGTFFDNALFRLKEIATWRELGSLALTTLWGWIAGALIFLQILALAAAGLVASYLGAGNRLYLDWQQLALYSQGDLDYYIRQGLLPSSGRIFEVSSQYWWVFLAAIPVLLLIFAYINGLLAAAGSSLSKLVLSPRPEEQEGQLAHLRASRATIVDAFEGERRRIERNLHDGVQQELVNLNLRLGLAQLEAKNLAAESQDDRASTLLKHLTEARAQLSQAQNTLRDTVRGIYPAVLEDHGLKAALEELVRHSVLATRLNYDAPARLPRDLERTAYYTVNEALTNTLKHAQAQSASLSVFLAGQSLVLTLEDDGVGGADPAQGTGLAGLMERAATLGGTVQVDSPAGGPTRLTLALPLPQDSVTP